MTIEPVTPGAPGPAFEAYIKKHRLLFHAPAWLASYSGKGLRQFCILNRNREMVGCFTYYVFRKHGFKCVITPPYMPDIALHFENRGESTVGRNSYAKEVMHAVAVQLRSEKAQYVNVNFPAAHSDGQPLIWNGFTARSRYTYHLHLNRTEEELWKNLSSEKRKSITKAGKDGVLIRPAASAEEVLTLVRRSLGRTGKGSHPEIVEGITQTYSASPGGIACVSVLDGRLIAASLCVIEGERAMYLFGGYDERGGHHGAHVSCLWQSILEARSRGCSIFDFEGSMNASIERYFRDFGPELQPYLCAEKINPMMRVLLFLKGHNPV